jgi:hypothetical protein
MREFGICSDEFNLRFADEKIEIANALGAIARLDDHRNLDERNCFFGESTR